MPANVEIKAVVHDWHGTCRAAAALADSPVEILEQEDTFFTCPQGRLKLRRFSSRRGELIVYHRPDSPGPKSSVYLLTQTSEPDALRAVLADALGVVGTVKKQRHLYLHGQTRIHLDQVEGLGTFLELEVVMQPGQDMAEGEQVADALMGKLGVRPEHLLAGAYLDMLLRRERTEATSAGLNS